MNCPNQVSNIATLHRQSIINWKQTDVKLKQSGFLHIVEENHAFNYQLWHTEDRARRDDLGFEAIYHAKRSIDHYNQQRNNRMEAMDEWLFVTLKPADPTQCPVHSETPGMMIDRLSILALKAYHMALQVERHDVDDTHRASCSQKVRVIHAQQQQLQTCLQQLLEDTQLKTRTFRIYHQFKMYNDPTLNPELY